VVELTLCHHEVVLLMMRTLHHYAHKAESLELCDFLGRLANEEIDETPGDAETDGAGKAGGGGITITVSDLNYRLRKAIKEPKRIFEAHQPYKKPGKGKRG